jgi:hypothetical protein
MYIFYKIYLQWIFWTLFFIARCYTIFDSELPKYTALGSSLEKFQMLCGFFDLQYYAIPGIQNIE